MRFVLLDSSAGPVPSSPKPKPHICNNMKNVSFYHKFLRTHHARGACYHFGTGIPSVSKMQCTTQTVYGNRDLFKTLTSMNIVSDHHNRIIYRFIELYRQPTRFICMLNDVVISQCNSILFILAPKYCVTKSAIVKDNFYCITVRIPCIFISCLVNHFLPRTELDSCDFGCAPQPCFMYKLHTTS